MKRKLKSIIRSCLPHSIRPHRILAGPLRGYRIVTSWHDYPAAITGRTERPLLGWFAENVRPGETWLDVGAHYGYTAIVLSRLVGSGGRVFAFEPMLSTAGYLSQTRLLNDFPQLTVLPIALGNPGDLSLIELPTTRGMVDSTVQNGEWTETILVDSLDRLWPQICGGDRQVDGVKIDVQGMEIEAIRGMAGLLSEFKPNLVVELHTGVDRDEFLGLMERLGYSRQARPVEPVDGESAPGYLDDRSYAFEAAQDV